jgi:hypothetical protein
MWKVRYYMVGGTLVTKYFPNLHEATQFAVYKAPLHSVHSMDRVTDGTSH